MSSQSLSVLEQELQDHYASSFLKPDIRESDCLLIDGNKGIVVIGKSDSNIDLEGYEADENCKVEFEVLDFEDKDAVMVLYDSLTNSDEVFTLEEQHGFIYRLASPSQFNNQNYRFASTKEEAIKELLINFD